MIRVSKFDDLQLDEFFEKCLILFWQFIVLFICKNMVLEKIEDILSLCVVKQKLGLNLM